MTEVLAAFSRSLRDLTRAEVLWQALWPPLVALAFWAIVAVAVWSHAVALTAQFLPLLPWSGWEWVTHWAAAFLLLAAFAGLVYFTAILLVAVIALPRLINLVAARDYPELGRHGENVFWGSLGNTLAAGLIFVAGFLLTLPLLLVPGGLLVLPMAWTSWLNQRTFRFDAVAEHATAAEMRRLVADNRSRFYIAGLGTAAAAHVPVVNLLVPAWTALVFVHLGLEALRRQRRNGGIQL